MSTESLRYGVVGTGMMGCEHIRFLEQLPGVEVTAIADPHEQSRAFGRLAVGADVECYADHRELLEKAAIDVVVIASPNHTHFDVLQDVFRTDKHVLVEKPLCTTVEDALAVAESARSHSGVFWVGMEYRYMRPVARLVEEVHGGAIGALHMLAIREHRYPFLPKVGNWNRFNRNTGGTLVEKCCHFFDLMNLVTRQRPVRVYASGGQSVNHKDERYDGEAPDILDNAYVTVDFDGGARGFLDLCMFGENSRNEMELAATGDRGKIEAFVPENRVIMNRRDRNEPSTIEFPPDRRLERLGSHHGATFFEHLALRNAIRSGEAPAVSADDGALAVAVGAAGELSARERRVVELAELGL
jgi:myo-inositol 2-dehydrogenase/D-chiro-inositol 1-dehydrogenase